MQSISIDLKSYAGMAFGLGLPLIWISYSVSIICQNIALAKIFSLGLVFVLFSF